VVVKASIGDAKAIGDFPVGGSQASIGEEGGPAFRTLVAMFPEPRWAREKQGHLALRKHAWQANLRK
jgi:hypothetical protein